MRTAVRAQFRLHAGETDQAKIDSLKLNAMSGLANYLTMESLRSDNTRHSTHMLHTPPPSVCSSTDESEILRTPSEFSQTWNVTRRNFFSVTDWNKRHTNFAFFL